MVKMVFTNQGENKMNDETKFPEPKAYGSWEALSPTSVYAWLKECIDEFPEYNRDNPFFCDSDGRLAWFDKWFSQFRIKETVK